jgi:hypothetical protein
MFNKSNRLSRLGSAFGLALVASLAATALAASSASALNTSPGGQAFSESSGSLLFSVTNGDRMTCTGSTGSGFWNATGTSGSASLLFKGCAWGGGFACTSPGQTSGNIQTSQLSFKPVYLDAAKTKFGLLLSPPASGIVAEAQCGFFKQVWTGSIIGEITSPPLNVSANKHTLRFERASGFDGVQRYQQIEGAGTKYSLKVSYSGGEPKGLALEMDSTLQYSNPTKFIP